MTEPTNEVKARREITFSTTGIPGIHGTFQHDKQTWIAAPAKKAAVLFHRAQDLADRAAAAQRLLSRVLAEHPDLYLELQPALLVLEAAAQRTPWGTALDAEIAAQAEQRAAEKRRAAVKFTH